MGNFGVTRELVFPETRPSFGPSTPEVYPEVSCQLLNVTTLSLPLLPSCLFSSTSCLIVHPCPRLACQLCKPPPSPDDQPIDYTQLRLPPHPIQGPGVSWKSQPAPDTCPRNKRGGVLREPPHTLPHQVKRRARLENPQS